MPQNPFAVVPQVEVPPEFLDRASLLAYLGLGEKELKKIRWYRAKMYQSFDLQKGSKKRTINAPDERLKFLQRRLLKVLEALYPARNPVHGFVANRSVVTNARSHLKRKNVLNLDLEDFFGSISENRVTGVLVSIGIDEPVAEAIGYICCCHGTLPQGAPTSPVLSNMICFRLDRELMAYAKSNHCIYTRYADDITFSSHRPMGSVFEGKLPLAGSFKMDFLDEKLLGIFSANGFSLNGNKLHYADKHSRRMVTGIKVNQLLNLDRRFVRNIRAILNSIETKGFNEAQEKFEQLGHYGSLRLHLRGKIEWLKSVKGSTDPVVRRFARRFNDCFPQQTIKVEPDENEKRARSTWIIENGEQQGSCVFVKGHGLITAAHCIKETEFAHVFHPSKPSNKFVVTASKFDKKRDLALLNNSIPSTEYFELELADSTAQIGAETLAIGFPNYGPGDSTNERPGFVSAKTKKFEVGLLEVTQKLTQGMSGGPLLNLGMEVIGIIHKGGPDEGRDFAVNLDELKAWLSE